MAQAPWWLGPAATFVGILVAAFMVTWQQRATARANLKLKVFELLREAFAVASTRCGSAGLLAFTLPDQIERFPELVRSGADPALPHRSVQRLIELHEEAGVAAADLIIRLEEHDIVSQHFGFFAQVIVCAQYDTRKRSQRLFELLTRLLPAYFPGDLQPRPELGIEDRRRLRELTDEYRGALADLQNYISDIQAETQNLLLHGLFKQGWFRSRKARRRVPPDPRFRVISLDDLPALRQYFCVDHPSAKYGRALTNEAAARADAGERPHP